MFGREHAASRCSGLPRSVVEKGRTHRRSGRGAPPPQPRARAPGLDHPHEPSRVTLNVIPRLRAVHRQTKGLRLRRWGSLVAAMRGPRAQRTREGLANRQSQLVGVNPLTSFTIGLMRQSQFVGVLHVDLTRRHDFPGAGSRVPRRIRGLRTRRLDGYGRRPEPRYSSGARMRRTSGP